MRKEIPILDSSITKKELLKIIVESFQTVIFATIDENDKPRSNAADIELVENNKLIFSTIKGRPFYNRLIKNPYISITGLKGNETMNSVAVTVDGKVKKVDKSYIDKIYAAHDEMEEISAADSDSTKDSLIPFAIIPRSASIYDLRQKPVFTKHFNFKE